MSYFKILPKVNYKIGSDSVYINNLSVFIDILNDTEDDASSYTFYNVNGEERPDNVAETVYGNPELHWLIFLGNPHLRKHGWPLTHLDLMNYCSEKYTGYTITTGSDLFSTDSNSKFEKGASISGAISQAQGTVISKDVNLGLINITVTSGTFVNNETIHETGTDNQIVSYKVMKRINGPHHYEDGDGNWIDINPANQVASQSNPYPANSTRITNYDYEFDLNTKRSKLKLFKPEIISKIL